MSTLVLVRHGQASAFTESPDRLTPIGWEQARLLGRYWAELDERFDAAYHGTLRRQRESYQATASALREEGKEFPEAIVLPGLNEYDAQDLIAEIAPRLAGRDSEFAPRWDSWIANSQSSDRNRRFQRMFEALVARWVDGTLEEPGLEPWESFRSRVATALRQIRESQTGGRRVVAFTSGGPIGVAVQSTLGASPNAAVEVNWRVRNTSLTRFLYSGSRVSLDGFNELPHLARSPRLVTFR